MRPYGFRLASFSIDEAEANGFRVWCFDLGLQLFFG